MLHITSASRLCFEFPTLTIHVFLILFKEAVLENATQLLLKKALIHTLHKPNQDLSLYTHLMWDTALIQSHRTAFIDIYILYI